MALECTLVRAPGAVETTEPEELSVAVPAGTSGTHVQQLLTAARGTGFLCVEGRALNTLTVGEPPLVSGAVLVDDGPPRREDPPHRRNNFPASPLMLLTHSGPGAGSIFRIQRGSHRIGRASAEIAVADPGMSREHAILEVSGTAVALRAADRAKPVFVDGRSTKRSLLTASSTVECGNSTFTVITDSSPCPQISGAAGLSVEAPREVRHTRRHGNRLAMALAAGLPLLAGIGLSLATGMWMYLGFTAISAISLLVPLIAGRKGRLEGKLALGRAVQEDIKRRRRCSPSAAEIILAVHDSSERGRSPVEQGAREPVVEEANATRLPAPAAEAEPGGHDVWLRLGITQSVANIQLVPADPHFRQPPIGAAPMTLNPGYPEVAVCGQPHHVDGLLRFFLMQLASFPSAAQTPVIVFGKLERLPLSARFLHQVTLTDCPSTALAALQQANGLGTGKLFMVDDLLPQDEESWLPLVKAARSARWQLIRCSLTPAPSAAVIVLSPTGTAGYLEAGNHRRPFVPDLVSAEVFDGFCRKRAASNSEERASAGATVPQACSLADLLPHGQRRVLRRWAEMSGHTGPAAVLGASRGGEVTFDFTLDGPHLLVAGTTGSGKSELLRTLVASMALRHSPDHTTFLFFDFKGGSGLQPLVSLPHCVGLLTDLAKHHLERALVSLRGEIRYREELFAAASVSDLAQYRSAASPTDPKVPFLVLVIDEFRMLVDEAPNSLRELMRIATIGRSLGIHLVMATQRPQGALTADIRANVTSSISMRVQTEAESMDIINTKAAATIKVSTPGRAFLAKASSSPEEFQTASLSPHVTVPASGLGSSPQAVQSASQALQRRPTVSRNAESQAGSLLDTGPECVVSTVRSAWHALGKALPKRPIALPLPASIPWREQVSEPDNARASREGRRAVGPLALVDRPHRQTMEPLLWSPSEDGHLAMIGGESSGMRECFMATSAMLATREPQPHLYILDATGTFGHLGDEVRIGAVVGLHQLQLAARVLQRLIGEMEHRRTPGALKTGNSPLVLIVAGWCSWAAALRTGPFAYAEGILQDIVRDGSSLGVTVLISGERELVSSRFFAGIQNRAYFPSGSSEESRFHWPRIPDVDSLPGRAVLMGKFAQDDGTVAQFRTAPVNERWPFDHLAPSDPPFRVRPLPGLLLAHDFRALLPLAEVLAESCAEIDTGLAEPLAVCDRVGSPVWIGVGGDEAVPVSMPLRKNGVSTILGGPRSGKSSALAALQALNPSVPWVVPPDALMAGDFWVSVAREAASGSLEPNSILLVDDATSLDPQGRQALADLVGRVRCIILAASPSPSLALHLPLAKEAQASGTGLVLAPGTPHDGDLLGVRLEAVRAGLPGRGFLINGSEVVPFHSVFTPDFSAHPKTS
ncbi:FtsK/SpoIIIE domain-containing protein [Paenarthrobacter aurescens]|uniref:FtsK/SpoIIIE domain-containing protein n=1 Tax=Paenarthrobacter aurescens TaxID=43663 RepID=UPI0011426E0B|nr:FtsK/SpoIIIE domain-containing protein [Paenarthrobacter aurescens]MDO6144103.1 cell division protein FtsK [Paenarthrobacter aurescens]MDO6147950.1 cell division protein FtsK [Paenarthrobacter aurescens]MDO6159194.1 cell division protein FtsK [Paenarthrobacter aurescens]MDO6163178.1 cell division protein FtsK [Paenarthrobacter aurescens]